MITRAKFNDLKQNYQFIQDSQILNIVIFILNRYLDIELVSYNHKLQLMLIQYNFILNLFHHASQESNLVRIIVSISIIVFQRELLANIQLQPMNQSNNSQRLHHLTEPNQDYLLLQTFQIHQFNANYCQCKLLEWLFMLYLNICDDYSFHRTKNLAFLHVICLITQPALQLSQDSNIIETLLFLYKTITQGLNCCLK
ncbi:hypothetical protein pb186bvf_011870 [Paramecium bursaria]